MIEANIKETTFSEYIVFIIFGDILSFHMKIIDIHNFTGKCHQFLCHETKHCLENKNNGCKTPTYQYCINHSLLCNGLPNCGVTDSSDEARCK